MQDNVVAKNISNNIFLGQNGVSLTLNIDQTTNKPLSLKNFLKKGFSAGALSVPNIEIQIILAPDVHLELVDDLLDFDIKKSKIKFVLNENSTVNYDLKMVTLPSFCHEGQCSVSFFDAQESVEKELDFKFVGQHSNAKVRCACKGTQEQIFKFKTTQDHQAPFTTSDLVVKSALCQKSKLICESLIKVDKDAQNVQASQLNKNLLLGCNSRAISIPKLEVKADDVKCKHGAAVAKLDEEQIFYLQSRGFDYCQAKEILVEAFLN
jgi:hypothetical protein